MASPLRSMCVLQALVGPHGRMLGTLAQMLGTPFQCCLSTPVVSMLTLSLSMVLTSQSSIWDVSSCCRSASSTQLHSMSRHLPTDPLKLFLFCTVALCTIAVPVLECFECDSIDRSSQGLSHKGLLKQPLHPCVLSALQTAPNALMLLLTCMLCMLCMPTMLQCLYALA